MRRGRSSTGRGGFQGKENALDSWSRWRMTETSSVWGYHQHWVQLSWLVPSFPSGRNCYRWFKHMMWTTCARLLGRWLNLKSAIFQDWVSMKNGAGNNQHLSKQVDARNPSNIEDKEWHSLLSPSTSHKNLMQNSH